MMQTKPYETSGRSQFSWAWFKIVVRKSRTQIFEWNENEMQLTTTPKCTAFAVNANQKSKTTTEMNSERTTTKMSEKI